MHSKSKLSKKLRLKAPKRKDGLTLEEAAAEGLVFLQAADPRAPSSSCAVEPRDMSVDGGHQEREDLESENEEKEG